MKNLSLLRNGVSFLTGFKKYHVFIANDFVDKESINTYYVYDVELKNKNKKKKRQVYYKGN